MSKNLLTYMNNFKHLYAQEFRSVSERYSMPQLEMDVVLFLQNNPGYNTARDITELRGFSKSNVSAAVDDLRSRGYLTSHTDAKSRRVQRLELTDEGVSAAKVFDECRGHCIKIIFADFDRSEIDTLLSLLARMDENIVRSLAAADDEQNTRSFEKGLAKTSD
ncbi:MAG: MarR family winged helix-turn-helix transcriptional regulator [Eubacteriales bacterium]